MACLKKVAERSLPHAMLDLNDCWFVWKIESGFEASVGGKVRPPDCYVWHPSQ